MINFVSIKDIASEVTNQNVLRVGEVYINEEVTLNLRETLVWVLVCVLEK